MESEELELLEEEDEDLEGDVDELDEEELVATDDEEETDEASLEELLAQRAAARRGTDEADEDEDLLSAFASERDEPATVDIPPSKVTPLRDTQEFVCNNCHLVKARVQLADEERGLCRDCV